MQLVTAGKVLDVLPPWMPCIQITHVIPLPSTDSGGATKAAGCSGVGGATKAAGGGATGKAEAADALPQAAAEAPLAGQPPLLAPQQPQHWPQAAEEPMAWDLELPRAG